MQITTATKTELMLLIHGLRSIHVSDKEIERHELAVQLENELSTRYGVMLGVTSDQERYDGNINKSYKGCSRTSYLHQTSQISRA